MATRSRPRSSRFWRGRSAGRNTLLCSNGLRSTQAGLVLFKFSCSSRTSSCSSANRLNAPKPPRRSSATSSAAILRAPRVQRIGGFQLRCRIIMRTKAQIYKSNTARSRFSPRQASTQTICPRACASRPRRKGRLRAFAARHTSTQCFRETTKHAP